MMNRTLSVSAIKNGTVIDHIQAGQALNIMHLLKLINVTQQMTLGLNLPSESLGKKDLIKIEDKFFTEDEAKQITLFAPQASINIVENFAVIKKLKTNLPEAVSKILICPNPKCVTGTEGIDSHFFVEQDGKRIMLTCRYCEKKFTRDELVTINYDRN